MKSPSHAQLIPLSWSWFLTSQAIIIYIYISNRRQVAEQLQSVVAYCSQRCHVLWDLHHEDALIRGNAGCSKPHLMLLDVFMPPDELLVCVLPCSFLHLSGLVLAFIVGAEISTFLPCSMTVHWLLFPPSFLSLVLFDSPHHCVGFLFFAWIPPGLRSFASAPSSSSAASLTHSLTHPPTHARTHALTHCLSRGRRSTQTSWTSCGAHGRRWGRGCLSRSRRSTQSLLDELRRAWPPLGPRLPFAWQAQYTEPPGRAAARVAAGGAAAAFRMAGAVHRASWTSCGARGRRWGRGCLSRGSRSTQSLLDAVRRAWPPLGPRLLSRVRRHLSFTLITHHLSHLTHHFSLSILTAHSPLITCHSSFTTHHYTTSHSPLFTVSSHHPNSSQLHYSHLTHHSSTSHTSLLTHSLITAPLLTPHFSHFTYHITTHHSSTSHTIFHTPSLTYHLLHTIFHTHTTFSPTIFDTPSFTHHFVTHNLSHTTLSHTIFHTQLCHTPSFAHHLSHTSSFTRNFVTHHLSSTSSFVFPYFPVPATTFLARYWKKLTCGVIRSFYFFFEDYWCWVLQACCRSVEFLLGLSFDWCLLRRAPVSDGMSWGFVMFVMHVVFTACDVDPGPHQPRTL